MSRRIVPAIVFVLLLADAATVGSQTKPSRPAADPKSQYQTQEIQQLPVQQQAPQLQQPLQAQRPTASAQQGELFVLPLPKGWKQVSEDRQFNIRTTQFAPDGQTADRWEEVLRSRTFFFIKDAPPENFLLEAARLPKDQCRDLMLAPVSTGLVNGYASAFTIRYCTEDRKTGLGEVAMLKVIQGRESLYLCERIWRVKSYAKDKLPMDKNRMEKSVGFMRAVSVCDPRDPKRACPKSPGN